MGENAYFGIFEPLITTFSDKIFKVISKEVTISFIIKICIGKIIMFTKKRFL